MHPHFSLLRIHKESFHSRKSGTMRCL